MKKSNEPAEQSFDALEPPVSLNDEPVVHPSLEIKKKKLEVMQAKIELARGLPHLYGWKNYKWCREFLETTNRNVFLTAANQIGKSSTQIRKVIDWATNKSLWPSLWRREPRQFWYLYPTREVASIEFETKWKPDFLPKGKFKDHEVYGWREEKKSRGEIFAVHFNSGVSVYFKTYAQDSQHLQSATVDYIATDEELPDHLYDELNFRRNATDGYFSMVFTATIGQELWRRTMEPKAGEEETFPTAWKKQVSLFDCMEFEDGTKSHWSMEKIHRTISSCATEAEVQRRVYGKFVIAHGLKYSSFSRANNVCKPFVIPQDWVHYVGVDLGAGGEKNHPSTITFIAISPDYKRGAVYRHWRGDEKVMDQTEVANKYLELKSFIPVTCAYYDYSGKDFKTITDRMGLSFQPAEKSHAVGEQIINGLFKNNMLVIFDIPETQPIINELTTLSATTDKRNAKDDSIDSMRYGVTKVPWDWSSVGLDITVPTATPKVYASPMDEANAARTQDAHRMRKNNFQEDINAEIEQELAAWDELYGI